MAAKMAGPIERAGLTGSAGDGDACYVDQDKSQTDGETCKVAGAFLFVSGTEHHEHEYECEDKFCNEGRHDVAGEEAV